MTRVTVENYSVEGAYLGDQRLEAHVFDGQTFLLDSVAALTGDPISLAYRVVSINDAMRTACVDIIKSDRDLLRNLQESYLEKLDEDEDGVLEEIVVENLVSNDNS